MVYVRRLVIEGFRSYRDKTTVTLSPDYNVIVGLNGHGKSNLLRAIEFVCANANLKLNTDAPKILHHVHSKPVTFARVDMVIGYRQHEEAIMKTNFCFEHSDEVMFSRRITMKKDDFFFNDKSVSAEVYRSRMQSVGFSSFQNPYYIVHQSRIGELSRQTDQQRYQLLLEAAGVMEYETKRKIAEKELAETSQRADSCGRVMKDIEKRLNALRDESAEIENYLSLTSQLTYCHERIKELTLESLRKDRDNRQKAVDDLSETLIGDGAIISALSANLEDGKTSLEDKMSEINRFEEERQSLRSRLDLITNTNEKEAAELRGLEEDEKEYQEKLEGLVQRISEIETEITRLQEENKIGSESLQTMESDLDEKRRSSKRVTHEKTVLDKKRDGKQGIYGTLQEKKDDLQDKLSAIEEEQQQINTIIKANQVKEAEQREKMRQSRARIEEMQEGKKDVGALKSKLVDVKAERAELEKKSHQCESELSMLGLEKQDLLGGSRLESRWSALGCSNPRKVTGIMAVQDAARALGLSDRIYGLLIENIRLRAVDGYDVKPYKAIDACGSNALDNLLVDCADTATKLTKEMRKRHVGGNVVFVPLREIEQKLKTQEGRDRRVPGNAQRVVDLLEFEPHVRPAVQQAFGQVLLVESIEHGHEATKLGWDAVTAEGTEISRRGVARGGIIKERFGSAERYLDNARRRDGYLKREAELQELRASLHRETGDVIMREKSLKSEQADCYDFNRGIDRQVAQMELELEPIDRDLEHCRKERNELESRMKLTNDETLRLRAELLNPDLAFNRDDQRRLNDLTKQHDQLKAEVTKAEETVNEMNEQIRERKDQIEAFSEDLKRAEADHREVQELERADTADQIKALRTRVRDAEQERERHEGKVGDVNETLTMIKSQRHKLEQSIQAMTKELEEREEYRRGQEATQAQAVEQLRYLEDKILEHERDLVGDTKKKRSGASNPAVEELHSLTVTALGRKRDELKVLLDDLKDKVNYAAVDELNKHQADYHQHLQTSEYLKEAEVHIRKMMEEFDERKKECMQASFTKVDREFREIFASIVPGGLARLIRVNENPDENDEPASKAEGITIKVSFSGQPNSYHRMEQLSGGQRTVVAVSLMFALQRAEAAPIYVLDEIDQALDDNYRYKVGKVMDAACDTSQFVMTTFRRQLAEFGRKFIEVKQIDRVSRHTTVDKEAAIAAIQEAAEQTNEGEE